MTSPAEIFLLSLLAPPGRPVHLPSPEDEAAWDEALRLLRWHMLEGLAFHRAGDRLPDPVQEALRSEHRRTGLHTTLLLESAGRARRALAEAGIPSLLYKGAALVASGAYVEPGARRMDDADLLVPTGRAPEAVRVLRDAGFVPWTEWTPEKVGWADATAFDDPESPPGIPLVVDLHWRVDYGRLRFGARAGEEILWEGGDLEAGLPAPEAHLAVVAEHLVKHLRYKVHLVAFADLGLLTGEVEDWDRVARLLRHRRLAPGIGALFAVARRELGHPLPRELVRVLEGGGRAAARRRRLLRPSALLGRRRPVDGRFRGLLFRWLLAGTPSRIAADVVEVLFPGRRWLAARYGRASRSGERGPFRTFLHWLRYLGHGLGWLAYRRRSPASPHESLFDPREPT